MTYDTFCQTRIYQTVHMDLPEANFSEYFTIVRYTFLKDVPLASSESQIIEKYEADPVLVEKNDYSLGNLELTETEILELRKLEENEMSELFMMFDNRTNEISNSTTTRLLSLRKTQYLRIMAKYNIEDLIKDGKLESVGNDIHKLSPVYFRASILFTNLLQPEKNREVSGKPVAIHKILSGGFFDELTGKIHTVRPSRWYS